MTKEPMRDRILEVAEHRARAGGYHGFSFRDIADDIGIKSASVHYHFPTKPDLMVAVADRYTERAADQLTPPEDARDGLAQVSALFRAALEVDDRMCLCGLLGAERDTIPNIVSESAGAYFRLLIDYLEPVMTESGAAVRPEMIVAALEGALIMARTLNDPTVLDNALRDLERQLG